MRISEITDEYIRFDNGNEITFDHFQSCCENNYADFTVINENYLEYDYDFDEELKFEFIGNEGFIFGSQDENGNNHWIFVPCYSEQNGYYTDEIDIFYNGELMLHGNCKPIIYY